MMRKKLLLIFLIGSICRIIADYILPHVSSPTPSGYAKEIYDTGEHFLLFFSDVSIKSSIILFGLREVFINSWEVLVSKVYEKFILKTNSHFDSIIKQIELIRENTDKLFDKFEQFMIDNKTPLSMENCQSIEEYNKLLIPPCRELFGRHIINSDSLFSYVRKVYLDGFSLKPHPSSVEKTIKVSESGQYHDYLTWDEHTTYRIHHVSFPATNEIGKYLLRFKTTSFAPDLDPSNWSKSIQVKLLVDNKSILPKNLQPTVVTDDVGSEGFFCKKDGDWIELWFEKYIELSKEWTEIECSEVTINSKLDKVLTLHTNKPTCKYKLDMTLPKNQKFIKHPFTSNKIIYSGLEESIKKCLPKETKIEHDDDHHVRMVIKEWVMPGIIVNFNWIDA